MTLMVARLGRSGDPTGLGGLDATIFNLFVIYGFFFITLIHTVSILLGDKSPVLVRFLPNVFT